MLYCAVLCALTAGAALQITCPDGYTACDGVCYSTTSVEDGRGNNPCTGVERLPLPTSQAQIQCLLVASFSSTLMVPTAYIDLDSMNFQSTDGTVVAPDALEGTPGPGSMNAGNCVAVHRVQASLVLHQCTDQVAFVCEMSPVTP